MKFSIAFAVLAAVVATVGAAPVETNAQRMARGLPPKAPARRATPAFVAERHEPSGWGGNGGGNGGGHGGGNNGGGWGNDGGDEHRN